MIDFKHFNKLTKYLYRPLNEYQYLFNKISNHETLTHDDFFLLQLFCKDICYFHSIDDSFLTELKVIDDLFNDEWFAKQVDSSQVEETNPDLFNQLALMRIIVQGKIQEEETIIHSLKYVELGIAKITNILVNNKKNSCCVPEGIQSALADFVKD